MATITSLICFGGKGTTKTVTFGTSNLVTLTNHGLRDGTGIQFSGGTLPTQNGGPTALAANTTYYAKSISANTFELYTEAALTNKILFNNDDSGTIYVKSAYYAGLSDKSRWTYGGTEYIFDSLNAWNTHRTTTVPALVDDTEVCEIGMNWDDRSSSTLTLTVVCASTLITSLVNGVRSNAFHAGVVGAGYSLTNTSTGTVLVTATTSYRIAIDGFSVISAYSSTQSGVNLQGTLNSALNIISYATGTISGGTGIAISGALGIANNCVVFGHYRGFITATSYGYSITNCIAAKCTFGFGRFGATGQRGFFYNNISIGNTTNWETQPTLLEGAGYNAGESGNSPWYIGSNTSLTLATSDFIDYANNDFRPALSTSPQVDTGYAFYGYIENDITDGDRPNYNNGGAEAVDVGPFEYNNGYGPHPNSVTVSLSGMVDGSRVAITKQSDGTELRNELLSSETTDSFSYDTSSDIPVYIWLRKGSSSVFYHPVKVAATILADGGLTYSFSGLQVEDIAAATYDAQIDTDWGINWSTGAITHDSGTTRYSVSMHQNESDSDTNIDAAPLMHGTTPTQFELINSGSISAGDLEDLYGGSIELTNGDIYTNVYTVGTLAASHDLYIYQGSTKLTQFWAAGHLDILTKTYDGSTGAIESGVLTVFARPWGYTYDYWVTGDTSGGGRHVAALSTATDSAITETTGTVAGWTDITHTFGDTNKDFGDVHGSQPYKVVIDCNNRPLSEVYQRNQYLTRAGAATLNGVPGDRYLAADSSYTPIKSAPFGTYSGGVFVGAKGVWLDNVPSGDLLNYILTDSDGNTHQNVAALNQSVTISGLTIGSRVQIYDTTNSTELFNDIASTSSVNWEDPSSPTGDRAIRVRIAYVSGATAKEFIEANIGTCGTSSTTKDVTYLASQVADAVYNSNAVDGSGVTGVTFTDTTVDVMNINISAGDTDLADLYAAWVYYAFTETGIASDIDYISAVDSANYIYTNLVWKNTTSPSVPLKISGGYAWDSVTEDPMDLIDTTGGTIFLAPPHVVAKTITVTGGNVVTGDIDEIAGKVLTAAQSTPIYADIRKVNNYTVDGDGQTGTEWGPV